MFKRVKVKPTSFIRGGRLVNKKGFTRRSVISKLFNPDFNTRLIDIKNQVQQWLFATDSPAYYRPGMTRTKFKNLANNVTVLESISESFDKNLNTYNKIIKDKVNGKTLLGVNNNKGELDRIVALERDKGRLYVEFMASNPIKLANNDLDPNAIKTLVKQLKKDTNNETLYFAAISYPVEKLYKRLGARHSKLEGHLEYTKNLRNTRNF